MGGSSTLNGFVASGVSGTLGTPATGNIPQGRAGAVGWTDKKGNLWLFGGYTSTASNSFNDLWEFTPATNQWAWDEREQRGVLRKLQCVPDGGHPQIAVVTGCFPLGAPSQKSRNSLYYSLL